MSTGWQFKEIVAGNFIKDQISGDKSRVFLQRQLLRQKIRHKISVIQTNIFVFVVFKIKHELKCQNELSLKYHFSGNTSLYVFITAIV